MQVNYLWQALYLLLKNASTKGMRIKTFPNKHLPTQSQQQRKV